MWEVVKGMLTSKKVIAAIAGTIVALATKYGLDLDTEAVMAIVSPIVAYIVGQGWADTGKEAAKIQAEAAKPPTAINRQ